MCTPFNYFLGALITFIKTSFFNDDALYNKNGFASIWNIEAMFTLYRIGFCSVAKVAPVQCEQELMFCYGAEIVPKCSRVNRSPIRRTICNAAF